MSNAAPLMQDGVDGEELPSLGSFILITNFDYRSGMLYGAVKKPVNTNSSTGPYKMKQEHVLGLQHVCKEHPAYLQGRHSLLSRKSKLDVYPFPLGFNENHKRIPCVLDSNSILKQYIEKSPKGQILVILFCF